MINIYSNDSQSALKYLKSTKANIHNVLVMTGNFNIRDSDQDPSYSFHNDLLVDIADSFDLMFSQSTNEVPTRYLDNVNNMNSVINLMFFKPNSLELNNHTIHPELHFSSDHAPLTVDITIKKEFVQDK